MAKIPIEKLKSFRQSRITRRAIPIRRLYNEILTTHTDSVTLELTDGDVRLDAISNRAERRKIERDILRQARKDRKIITARDNSVQRENVWKDNPEKQSSFIGHTAVGKGGLQPIHLLHLQDAYDHAVKMHDTLFAGLLKLFIDEGYVYAHIDGGNRCDTYITFFKGDIFIEPGCYQFLPVEDEEVGHYEVIDDDEIDCFKLEENHPAIYDKLLESEVLVYLYHDLSREERSEWFHVLNDGEALNAAELRNRIISQICKIIRDDLNKNYKDLLVTTGSIEVNQAKRYGACEYIARLNHLAFTTNIKQPTLLIENERVKSLNECPTWASPTVLDTDYLSNSAADRYLPIFNKFFVQKYVPLLKLQNKMKSGKVQKLLSKNIMVDFFFLNYYLEKFNFKIQPNMKKNLVRKFHAWEILQFADTKTEYYVGKTDVTYRTWKQMYSGNSPENMANRFPTIINKLIPILIEKNIIAQVDSVRGHTKQQKAEMAKNQGLSLDSGPFSSDSIELEVMDLFDGDVIHGDHKDKPFRSGGPTTVDNGSLETKEYNLKKSDKLPEEVS